MRATLRYRIRLLVASMHSLSLQRYMHTISILWTCDGLAGERHNVRCIHQLMHECVRVCVTIGSYVRTLA